MSVGAGRGGSMLEHGERVSGYTTEERAFSSPQQSSIANSSPIRRGAPSALSHPCLIIFLLSGLIFLKARDIVLNIHISPPFQTSFFLTC